MRGILLQLSCIESLSCATLPSMRSASRWILSSVWSRCICLCSKMAPRGRGAELTRACAYVALSKKGCPSCPYCSAMVLVQEALGKWREQWDPPEAKLVPFLDAEKEDVKRIALLPSSAIWFKRLGLVTLTSKFLARTGSPTASVPCGRANGGQGIK